MRKKTSEWILMLTSVEYFPYTNTRIFKKVKGEPGHKNKLQVINGKMEIICIYKSLFAQINNKCFNFSAGILSPPIGPPSLLKIKEI